MEFAELRIYSIDSPLKHPYKLSYNEIKQFRSLVFEVLNESGEKRYSEVTFLEGYSGETMEGSIKLLKHICKELKDVQLNSNDRVFALLEKYLDKNPFLVTGLYCAFESFYLEKMDHGVKVPIIETIDGEDESGIENNAKVIREQGFKAVKIKIGYFSIEKDMQRIYWTRKYCGKSMEIRVDANQAIRFKELVKYIDYLGELKIQYMEQPFKSADWDAHKKLNKIAPFSVMLDESIWNEEDIERAAGEECADYIKLKLQKCGNMKRIEGMIKQAFNLGLKIILGNGVQTDLMNILEAYVYRKTGLVYAAENIGFKKMADNITNNKIDVSNGYAHFHSCQVEELNDRFFKSADMISELKIGG